MPAAVAGNDYSNYFEPLGNLEDFSEIYEFSDQCTNEGKVYGVSSSGNVQGIVYNKRIWKEAGINELPKTPDEFINDLELIKKNTDSIPLYTNYEAVWPLSAWCSYMYACATGNENYKNYVLPYEKTPFSKKSDNTGPYEVFSILYNSVSKGHTEEDPTTTSWELSKGALNRGEISAMVLGSWSVSQIKDADSFAEDVGYMPFPISVGGMQYSIAVGDYSYGINCKIPNERKTAAKIFIKYLIEDSGFAFDHESIPTLKGEEYPAVLESFEDTTFIRDIPPTKEDGDILSLLNADSELMFNSDSTCIIRIVDAALSGEETYDEIMNDWNKAWNKAQEKNNITISD